MTVKQIKRRLLGDGVVFFTLDGAEYFASWDEDCTAIYYWRCGGGERAPAAGYLGHDEREAAKALHDLHAVTPGAPDQGRTNG
jgi:hypothetical protein